MKTFVCMLCLLVCLSGVAQAGTKIVADRNTESDMKLYNVYACFTAGCVVTKTAAMFQTTIVQPAVGTLPTWIYPVNVTGQAALTAVDLSVNESALSNTVNFDGAAPAPPLNVREQ